VKSLILDDFLRKSSRTYSIPSGFSEENPEILVFLDFNTKVLKSSDFTRIEDSRGIYLSRDFKEISRTSGFKE